MIEEGEREFDEKFPLTRMEGEPTSFTYLLPEVFNNQKLNFKSFHRSRSIKLLEAERERIEGYKVLFTDEKGKTEHEWKLENLKRKGWNDAIDHILSDLDSIINKLSQK